MAYLQLSNPMPTECWSLLTTFLLKYAERLSFDLNYILLNNFMKVLYYILLRIKSLLILSYNPYLYVIIQNF